MPASNKQLAANRKNAQKSTGPQTAAGKLRSRGNALKHGFYASDDIIVQSAAVDDDKDQYRLLLDSLYEELAPTTIFQEFLVRKIANALWRGRRALITETANINDQIATFRSIFTRHTDLYDDSDDDYVEEEDDQPPDDDEPDPLAERTRLHAIPYDRNSVHIQRYEMRLDKQISRAYNLLMKLQKIDRSEPADPGEPEI